MQTISQTATGRAKGSAVVPGQASRDAQPGRAHREHPRVDDGDVRAGEGRSVQRPVSIAAGTPATVIGTVIVGDLAAQADLELADGVTPGTTIYIDGRFYRCIDRLRLGGDGSFDIVQVTRHTFGPDAKVPFGTITVQVLTDLELQGRAALVASRKPGGDPAFEGPSPAGPTPSPIAAAMRMS